MRRIFKLSALLVYLLSNINSFSKTIEVPSDATSIQNAIYLASNGDTVVVAPGIYYENINFKGKNIFLTSNYLYSNNDLHNSFLQSDYSIWLYLNHQP